MQESFFEIESKFQELYFSDDPDFFSKITTRVFYYLVNNQLNFDPNELDGDGRSILTEISLTGDLYAVKWLVNAGANPNYLGRNFNFSLANAAGSGWKEVYDYLRPISDIYITNPNPDSIAEYSDIYITNLDLDSIAEYNFRSNQQIYMRICEFIKKQDFTRIRRTIMTNSHCTSGINGVRILAEAVAQRHIRLVEILLDFGAETTHNYGIISSNKVPMSIACAQGNLEIVKILVDSGGSVNLFTKRTKYWTPLMYAVSSGNLDVIKLLLDKGADIGEINENGDSALTIAINCNYKDIVNYIENIM